MRPRERPVGLWIVPGFDVVGIGVIPLVGLLMIYQDPDVEISVITLALTAALRLTVIGAALGTWSGDNTSRLVLMHAVTLACILTIIGNGEWLQELIATRDVRALSLIRNMYQGAVWIGINWWYLNRQRTKEYFDLKPLDA